MRSSIRFVPGLLVALNSLFLFADIAPDPYARGTILVPVRYHTRVRMAEESVTIRRQGNLAHVSATFRMRNDHDAESLEVGFLGRSKGELQNFRARVDGKSVVVKDGAPPNWRPISYGNSETDWKYWKMEFPSGKDRMVSVEYDTAAKPRPALQIGESSAWYRGQTRADFDRITAEIEIAYMLKSAQEWEGNIGAATIEIELDTPLTGRLVSAQPAGAKTAGRSVTWRLRDHYPREDVRLLVYANSTVDEVCAYLEKLAGQHRTDRALATQAGQRLASAGRKVAAATVYGEHLLASPATASNDEIDMAAYALTELDAAGRSDQVRRLAPRACPALRRFAQSRAGKRHYVTGEYRGPAMQPPLAICDRYKQ